MSGVVSQRQGVRWVRHEDTTRKVTSHLLRVQRYTLKHGVMRRFVNHIPLYTCVEIQDRKEPRYLCGSDEALLDLREVDALCAIAH